MSVPPRVVFHLDMNAFFISVERAGNPLLRGRPAAVVGDVSRRGIVLTASYEARAFGVKTAMTVGEARRLCPGLTLVESRFEKYADASERIHGVLVRFSDRVEMTSCDEAYLDMTASCRFWDGPERAALALQARVKEELGLPCSVGVAPNKLLAKAASDAKKPDGVTVVRPEDVASFLRDRPVGDLCGVGRRLSEQLAALGIRTCGELGRANAQTLYARFGVTGEKLRHMGRGEDDAPVSVAGELDTAKSMSHFCTFPRDVEDPELLKSYLLMLAEKVGRRLRAARRAGRTANLTVRYRDFETVGRQARLKEPVCEDAAIYKAMLRLFEGFRPLKKPLRLFGVGMSDLAADPAGGYLFDDFDRPRRRSAAVDFLNEKYGERTVRHARVRLAEEHGILKTPMPPKRPF